MHLIARLGDKTSHGGTIITASERHTLEGRGIARIGDAVTCPRHGTNRIVDSPASNHTVDGRGIAVIGAKCACGATIVSGSDKGSTAEN